MFVAGGVGINPLISMLGSIVEEEERRDGGKAGFQVRFLYSVRLSKTEDGRSEEILFLERLRELLGKLGDEGSFKLFVTGGGDAGKDDAQALGAERRRIQKSDLEDALGSVGVREGTVCYVCGVPGMTDEFVDVASRAEGMDARRVLSEKWW